MAGAHPLAEMPSGTEVRVRMDNGKPFYTKTRSEPWQLGWGGWVVLLEGQSGGYSLDRMEALTWRKA